MAGLATQETNKSVAAFIETIASPTKKADSETLVALMQKITGLPPKVWGDNFLIAFGKYKYKRKGGKEEYEWFHVGFAPRKTKLTIYLTMDLTQHEDLLEKLGKCKWGKGCLYIKKLADVNMKVLEKLISKSKNARWH